MNFLSFSGVVTMIEDFWTTPTAENGGCFQFFSVDNWGGNLVNYRHVLNLVKGTSKRQVKTRVQFLGELDSCWYLI